MFRFWSVALHILVMDKDQKCFLSQKCWLYNIAKGSKLLLYIYIYNIIEKGEIFHLIVFATTLDYGEKDLFFQCLSHGSTMII